MAWIQLIEEDAAEGPLKQAYDAVRQPGTPIAEILKVHSLHPETLRPHFDLYRAIMYGKSEVSRADREMIGVVVSAINRCHY